LSRNIKNGKKGKKKMRHRKSGKKLGRTWEHRKAMFRNMAKSLIVHERIRTTVPKARELSRIMDKLVTLALRDDLSARRQAYKVLENHKLVQKLFNEIGPKFSAGKGGYTRVVKFATPRAGDSAAMALIEFTFFDASAEEKPRPAQAAGTVAAPVPSAQDETAPDKDVLEEPGTDDQARAEEEAPPDQDEETPASPEESSPEEEAPESEVPEAAHEEEKQPAAQEEPGAEPKDQPDDTGPEKEK
jgi:large subunit ribosomal protein L17